MARTINYNLYQGLIVCHQSFKTITDVTGLKRAELVFLLEIVHLIFCSVSIKDHLTESGCK